MRPKPAARHHWAVVILIAVAAANTALTFRQTDITADQANMLAEAFKRNDPALYPSDGIFAASGPGAAWRMRLPAWQAVLAGAVKLTGASDPLNALRTLGAVALVVYLLSMYLLLYRQTHSSSMATLVAVFSTAIFSVERPYWGLGPIFAVTPATLYLAIVPLLALGFVRLRRRWSGPAVFFVAGLLGNLHLTSAVNLVAVMLIALLALDRFRPRAWALAGLGVVAAAAGAAPAIYHYYVAFRAVGVVLPRVPIAQARAALQLAGLNVLYPGVLVEAIRWLPVPVLLAVPPAVIVTRAGRYRVRDLGAWLWLLAAAGIVAFGLHGLVQLIAWWLGRLPPIIELFDALRLVMLPLYVLFAQAMVHLIRLARSNRAWVRAGLAVFAVVHLGVSFNTRAIRHMVRDAVVAAAKEEPLVRAGSARRAELRAVARWAAKNTPPEALFICPYAEIRLYGRRSLLYCPADVLYLYHLAPDRLAQWTERLEDQNSLLKPQEGSQVDVDSILANVDTHWAQDSLGSAETYVLLPGAARLPPTPRLQEIIPPKEPAPPAGSWGQHWRLFRVLPFVPTTATSPS